MYQLTYIYHDCFLLQTPECAIVFDYWKDPDASEQFLPGFLREIPGDCPLYVFVSHFHKDHFNKCIFGWENIHPDIHFVISRDVARHARYLLKEDSLYNGERPESSAVTILSKGERFSDSIIEAEAFGSTDIGNSYAIILKKSGLKVFHAGDLNCWAWRDESTPEEIRAAENAFRSELAPIAAAYPAFDIAMFPVDSRIGSGYAQGAREFASRIAVARFFPMHFTLGDNPEEMARRREDAENFAEYAVGCGEYIALTRRGDSCRIEGNPSKDDSGAAAAPETDRRILRRTYFLSAGETDADRNLSLQTLTSKLIDIATEHANSIGIGNPDMPDDHSGWVLSRLTIDMADYPKVDENYSISTWVENWNRHFSERAFSIQNGEGKTVGYARSIWMVLDTVTHANAGLERLNIRSEDILGEECPIRRQARHIALIPSSETAEASGKYLVASDGYRRHRFGFSDLDAYRHVNTVRYVALLMDQYTLAEHDERQIARLEMSFLHEGAYGKELDILRAPLPEDADGRWEAFELRQSDDRSPVLFARIRTVPRKGGIPTL